MAKAKLILICHFGGDFVTNGEGTMSYNGGEANALKFAGGWGLWCGPKDHKYEIFPPIKQEKPDCYKEWQGC